MQNNIFLYFVIQQHHRMHLDYCGINEFEEIRKKLRDLMKYLPKKKVHYDTNFEDSIEYIVHNGMMKD